MNAKKLLTLTLTLISLATYHDAYAAAAEPAGAHEAVQLGAAQLAEHQQALFTAIKDDNKEAFNATLALLPSLEFKNEQGETPLLYTAATSDSSLYAHTLVQKKANINAQHPNGSGTPLLIALKRPYNKILWPLLSALMPENADIEATDSNDKTALLLAIEQLPVDDDPTALSVLNTLVHRDATSDAIDENGNNALMLAVKKNDVRAADTLLNYAERMFKFDLHYGARIYIEDTNYDNESALSLAIKMGNPDMVKLLVIAGANHMAGDATGTTSLYAIASPELQLIIRNAIDEQMIETEKTRLLQAQFLLRQGIKSRDVQLIDDALAKGANINYAEQPGWDDSPLVYAIEIASPPDIIDALLDRKADIDHMQFKTGLTPLMYAIKHKRHDATQALLENNANIQSCTHTSALHLAFEQNQPDLALQLINLNAPVNAHSYPTTMRAAVHSNFDMTPLHMATLRRYVKPMEELIKAGADLDCKDGNHQTPLSMARQIDLQHGTTLVATIEGAIKAREEIKREALRRSFGARVNATANKKADEKSSLADCAEAIALPVAASADEGDEKKDSEDAIAEQYEDANATTTPDKSHWLLVD